MPIHPRRIILRTLVVLLLVLAWVVPSRPARAILKLNSDPMAIISAVNALRASQGLPPYVVDSGLMAYALEHSRYQASLHTATHQHSDGSTVWQHGMDENIAEGMLGYLTPEYAVYNIWSDAIHMKTMIGYATGSVGAGVADDGANEYYTLDVRPGSGSGAGTTRTGGKVDPNATPTKITPIVPLLTVTPRPDRWIIHTVGYGQSLWGVAIAYGVKMDQIRAWNSMAQDAKEIYTGQKLYIIAPTQIWPLQPTSTATLPGTAAVTPGWSITEEPLAATEKAAYQTAVAQTQTPLPEAFVAQNTASPPPSEQAAQVNQVSATSPERQSSASPVSGYEMTDTAAPPAAEEDSGNLPVIAGVLILAGGGLLLVITFWMLRRK